MYSVCIKYVIYFKKFAKKNVYWINIKYITNIYLILTLGDGNDSCKIRRLNCNPLNLLYFLQQII